MPQLANIVWVLDHRRRSVLQLTIDGHLAHIPAAQPAALLHRGIVQGVGYVASAWRSQQAHPFLTRAIPAELTEQQLRGCTDDPTVVALHREMCRAISTGYWTPGPRPVPLPGAMTYTTALRSADGHKKENRDDR
jgi:hypothetical protein